MNYHGSITATQKAGKKAPGKKAAKASIMKVTRDMNKGTKCTQAEVIGDSSAGEPVVKRLRRRG